MYNSFFGFNSKPFQIEPNPDFLYLSPNHKQALTHIEYGLMDQIGLIVLTGEVGTGKTTLIRFIIKHLFGDRLVAAIYHTNVKPNEFLGLILNSFNLQSESNHKDAQIETLVRFLKDKQFQKQKVLIIIDEAQGLSDETLEEVRLLTNLQIDFAEVMQIILMGQPELLDRLRSTRWQSFSQRIGVNFHLTGLDLKQTCLYIAHRLKKATA
jgi:general secretion pathway protein A